MNDVGGQAPTTEDPTDGLEVPPTFAEAHADAVDFARLAGSLADDPGRLGDLLEFLKGDSERD